MTFQVVIAEIDFDDFEAVLTVPIHIERHLRCREECDIWLGTTNLPMSG